MTQHRGASRAWPVGDRRTAVARGGCWLGAALLALACAPSTPAPAPRAPFDWDAAARVPRPFTWQLEGGAWQACTLVVRTARPLDEGDAAELEAVLTDWYNLARLGAFKDDEREASAAAAEAMGEPWQPVDDTLAVTLDLGNMPRSGLVVLLNALEGYDADQASLRDVVLCAERVPPLRPPRQTT